MNTISHIPQILRNHAEGAAFLWSRRAQYLNDPTIAEADLGRIDRRLIAHLDGLIASGSQALVELRDRFNDFPEAGEAFAHLKTAIAGQEADSVTELLGIANDLPETWSGLSAAVGWSSLEQLRLFVNDWAKSPLTVARFLAVAAHSHFRIDPGEMLADFLSDPDSRVRARALRLLGEIGQLKDLDKLVSAIADSSEHERFSAARSAILLGQRGTALDFLRRRAQKDDRVGDKALELAVLADHGEEGNQWLGSIIKDKARRLAGIKISAVIKTDAVRKWLFDCASDPELSAAAGIAMRTMYDVDFDDSSAFETDGKSLGPEFESRTDGPWPVASRVKAALNQGPSDPPFRCLPRLRRECLSQAIAAPDKPLREWRSPRTYPAWS